MEAQLMTATAPDTVAYRLAMRRFAGNVSVITVGSGDRRSGLVATSTVSLSVDPPLMLVCRQPQLVLLAPLCSLWAFRGEFTRAAPPADRRALHWAGRHQGQRPLCAGHMAERPHGRATPDRSLGGARLRDRGHDREIHPYDSYRPGTLHGDRRGKGCTGLLAGRISSDRDRFALTVTCIVHHFVEMF